MKKRGILFLLILMMLLGAFISNEKALAAGKKVDVSITDLSITNSSGEVPPGGYSVYMLFKLSIKWNASKHGNTLYGKELYGTPVVMLLSNVRIEKSLIQ